ncbi:uncharacterized protein BCR38DRAFT_432273 [Pseudomassariella vexata]|uniref:Uncharacterized protein n=1 Tax=Pseudomassariella vexata TaxID=1141098 RepID=A0A1Y2E161_9PEZI|nr:uncharacterized protein BCR38DRAFT_432273 [Pseudomassariella vexata]ORY65270.1 hypothetical protein BCR38DRAFT_432273 [Pseudomassariella vexata]
MGGHENSAREFGKMFTCHEDLFDPTKEEPSSRTHCVIDDQSTSLEVMSTTWEECYAALLKMFIHISDGIIVPYSVAHHSSLEVAEKAIRLLISEAEGIDRCMWPVILVAVDVEPGVAREVPRGTAEELAFRLGVEHHECYIKREAEVEGVFHRLVKRIRQHRCPNATYPSP